jgi:hypothetical protein
VKVRSPPVKPFAGRSRPSSALDPERTAQVDPKRSLGTCHGFRRHCPTAIARAGELDPVRHISGDLTPEMQCAPRHDPELRQTGTQQ